ncbi:MAG TPA: carbamoyltransferase HypF [Thermodesulfovibrionales bacterium]|nr:carbamoyltransferase HypF [Thermodesulfovibrionales bacterium]
MAERAKITVRGIVQGVGFRPYIYTLAESLSLRGTVMNAAEGVVIDVEGDNIPEFLRRLPKEAPPLSRITDILIAPLHEEGLTGFRIVESRDNGGYEPFTLVSPDVSICDDCLKELRDPHDRRYLYPFINCTNCGPRYTITKSVPYDRPNTTMSDFRMCAECNEEYNNPRDRRFHAQPNACPKCGPQVQFQVPSSKFKVDEKEDPIASAVRLLKQGAVVAIKGLGGFHIACDASNVDAVARLRERKRKNNKPFALMAPDIDAIREFCVVSEEEELLILSYRRPVVLLEKKDLTDSLLSHEVSPHNRYLGFMLPYTPLHYLLFYQPSPSNPPLTREGLTSDRRDESLYVTHHSSRVMNFKALVMTSGNISEEPIVKDNAEAIEKLCGLVDAVLFHDRDIFTRVDDSVVRVMSRTIDVGLQTADRDLNPARVARHVSPSFIRRSRGYAPEALPLHSSGPEVLGCGADIKNTFTLTKGSFAIPSQHIGDMENYETLRFFEECLEKMKDVYRVAPAACAHDLHPGYLSTRWALRQDLPKVALQHHYAHIGSVMAEHGLLKKVIGVAFDGTGYGPDGKLWGGEFLVADVKGFERVGHFRYIRLPGGEAAIREPWKTAISYLFDAVGNEAMEYAGTIGFTERYGEENIERVLKVINAGEFSPLSSGAGRLFDAVSSLIGICDRNSFEGEAAMALEAVIKNVVDDSYPVDITVSDLVTVDFSQTITGIVKDLLRRCEKHVISAKFHNTVSDVILRVALRISEVCALKDIVLSGGTFQNLYLLQRTIRALTKEGLRVFINERVPCNDAGISLGQAYLCRERLKERGE